MKWSKMTHAGLVRTINEDFLCARPDLGLFAVADGMGGHNAGEVASREAIRVLEEVIESNLTSDKERGQFLHQAILEANQFIYNLSNQDASFIGMGTTVTASCFNGMNLKVVHVGDSRCYLIRDSTIHRLTQDHSLVGELVRQNKITSLEATQHPHRNVLLRALGTSPEVQVDIIDCKLNVNDIILMCTDGVTEYLSDEELMYFSKNNEPENAVVNIVNEVLKRGGSDNTTLIMVVID